MAKVEIIGLERLKQTIRNVVPTEMRPMVLRELAKKPAMKAAGAARVLLPIGDTGATARTIGVLKVRNPRWTFVEVGFRGRSLGHIYMSGSVITRRKRGSVKGFPWLFEKTGQQSQAWKGDMKVDLTKLFVRAFKKRGIGR